MSTGVSNLEATISLGWRACQYLWRSFTGTEKVGLVYDTMRVLYPKAPKPKHIVTYRTETGWTLKYVLTPGCSYEDLLHKQDRLSDACRSFVDIERDSAGYVLINVYEKDLQDYYPYEIPEPPEDMSLPVPIGYSAKGLEWFDLTDAPHMLVAGESGFGKSNFLHGLIRSLLPYARVCVLDMKQLEYAYLGEHILLAETEPEGLKLLKQIEGEMERRKAILKKAGCVKIQEYQGKMPFIVLIIDEFAELRDKRILAIIDRLVRLARAVGISIVAATQRPDYKVLPGQLKANIPAALCFRVKNGVNSDIVLDNTRAAYLPRIRGRAIWQFDREIEVQVPWLTTAQAREMLQRVPERAVAQEEQKAEILPF